MRIKKLYRLPFDEVSIAGQRLLDVFSRNGVTQLVATLNELIEASNAQAAEIAELRKAIKPRKDKVVKYKPEFVPIEDEDYDTN